MNKPPLKKISEYPILGSVRDPEDLKALPESDLKPLAEEIRECLVSRVSENGGHLASNLGVVELTIALHRVFDAPQDHIIFDVGHQSYVHKLLTGRQDRFETLRQSGGISGFPKRSESEYDCFGTGHSSTSLSAALGFAESDRLSGSNAYTVCILGDGAYTGGMVHEALNNCRKNLRLIIILNENEMSISKNIGRFAKNLSHLRSSHGYIWTKNAIAKLLSHIPWIGPKIFRGLLRLKKGLKSALYGSNTFEDLGLFYFGPADGNNEELVEKLLREAKDCKQSCIIHLKTKKGKGYSPAEATPARFHGMSPAGSPVHEEGNFSEQMGDELVALAAKNEKICAITAAMTSGTGLGKFRSTYPQRFFDVGIAEEHAVTFAAGLAANGYRPAVAIYSTFLQRAYDNVIHDVALQNLPVVFFVDRAGMNASDGPTHAGVFDVAFLSEIPNLRIYTPPTVQALHVAMREAFRLDGPSVIRYPNGYQDPAVIERFYGSAPPCRVSVRNDYLNQPTDTPESLDAVIVTHGRIVKEAIRAEEQLAEEGVRTGILLLEMLKPYDEVAKELLPFLPQRSCAILFLEEEVRAGGMGMLLSDALRDLPGMQNKHTSILALNDPFTVPGKGETCLHAAGLDAESITETILKLCKGM